MGGREGGREGGKEGGREGETADYFVWKQAAPIVLAIAIVFAMLFR